MKTTKFKKGLSLFLAVVMLLTMMPAIGLIPEAEAAYPVMKATNAASSNGYYKYYNKITTITFLDEIKIEGEPVEQWDMSDSGDGSVMAWAYIDEEATAAAGENRYEVYVAGDGGVAPHADSTHFFYLFQSLKEIRGMENLHTGSVKRFYLWFGNCVELEKADLSYLDTSSATSLELCFYACYKLKEIYASSWDVSNVTTLKEMFKRCYSLETADLSGWETSKVTNMYGVFDMNPPNGTSPDYSLENVDLTGWNTSNVTTMENMFRNNEDLETLDLSSFDTSKVTTMRFMFYYCKNLKNIYAGEGWTTESIANLNDGIFNCCYALIGQTDDQQTNIDIYNDKHPSAYYPPAADYAKFREENGYLDNVANKPEKPKYTVTYKFVGDIIPDGVSVIDPVTYEEGTTVTVADDASAEHYIFSGWSTEDAAVDADGNFIINNDVEFVGSWTKLYRVEYKYDENYELPADAPQIPDTELWFAPGEDVPLYGIPYVYEYVFVGWNTEDADVVGDSFIMPENDVLFVGFYKIPVESVEIMGGDITVDIDETTRINVYVKPEDATIPDITFESSDETVVKVDKYGNVIPVGEGIATVTVKSVDDPTKTDTITVTVKIPVTDITVDKTEISLNKGDKDKITVTEVKPAEATNKDVTYESSDETVVKVDEKGNIEAVGEGKATIIVTSKDNKDVKEEVTVTVKIPVTEITVTEDFTLNVGEEKNIGAKVNEDATNKALIYESSDPGIVKIDSEGNIVAVGEGTATITVTSKDNKEITETVTVTVKVPVDSIESEKKEITLTDGDKDTIKVTVTPDNATNKGVSFESSDETVVRVDEKGNIEAVGEGEATITVTSKDDESVTETVKITVIKKTYKVTYEFIGDVIPENVEAPSMKEYKDGSTVKVEADAAADGYIFSGWSTEDAAVENGEFKITNDVHFVGLWQKINYYDVTYKYEGTVPENAPAVPEKETYEEGSEVTVENAPSLDGYTFSGWETKDAEVKDGEFTINNDVEFVGKWEKKTVSVDGITVEKDEFTLTEGDKDTIKVTVTPDNATNKDVTYTSSDETVVKVDEKGNIEAVGEGEATITVTTEDGKKQVTVTVKVEKKNEPEQPDIPDVPDEPDEPEYVFEVPETITVTKGITELLNVKVTPDDGRYRPTFSSADESIAKVDEFGNVTGVSAGTTTIYVDFGNGIIRPVTVLVIAPAAPVIPRKHHVCFGKTDGIGWYEVSVNGGDFFPQGPNSTLEVYEGSILVVRVQDMWIDDEFDFYVNGKKVPLDPANTITVVVDGYMLIGALSMDVPVPDIEESLNIFERILKALADFFNWVKSWFKK